MTGPRSVHLAFGRDGLKVDVPAGVDVILPAHPPAAADPAAEVRRALRSPDFGPPLRALAPPGSLVAVSMCDVTRAFPARVVLPVLLDELEGRRVRLVVATGTHRACTDAELERMFGGEVMAACEVVQNDADDAGMHASVGTIPGTAVEARIDRRFLEADARVTLGFVEPHFFAGFSGGPKMVTPGLADLATVRELHSAKRIADVRATWGVLDGNPVHDPIRAVAALADVTFALDVALDGAQRIAAAFSGDLDREHRAACTFVRETAMVRVPAPYDVVLTTNSGYPLDQNLYQCVKGLRAAAGIVRPGGRIVLAAACEDGLPAHGRYARLLASSSGPAEFVERLERGEVDERDQWQVQVQAEIQLRAEVVGHTPGVPPDDLRRAWIEPVADVGAALREGLERAGPGARGAILPDGPLTIAYVG